MNVRKGKQFVQHIKDFNVPEGAIGIWHLNQLGFAFKGKSVTVYIDPYLSDDLINITRDRPDMHSRIYDPLLRGGDIDNADYVLCTHDHLDHLDPTTVVQIAKASPKAIFVVPLHAKRHMEELGIDSNRIEFIEAGSSKNLTNIKVQAFIGAHETFDIDEKYGYAYLSYLITLNGYNIFHAGDTILTDELVEGTKGIPVDIAILPINGREYQKLKKDIRGNMNFKEAADFAVELNADLVIPGHWGMHYENTERPGLFVDYIIEQHRFQRFRVMVPGDHLVYMK